VKTQAAILVEQRRDLVVDEVEIPDPEYGQLLCKVHASRICGSQLGEIDGVKGEDPWLPHLLGHEAGADVVAVGPGVTTVAPGDRVVLHWRKGSGVDAPPPRCSWLGRQLHAGQVTTFSEYTVVAENRATKVGETVDYEICALLADTLTTGLGVANNDARIKIGEATVVFGCGGIGLGIVLGAKLAGAYPLVAVDLFDHKLEVARTYGASHTINGRREDLDEVLLAILEDESFDVAIDTTGASSMIERGYAVTGPRGRCVGVGVMPREEVIRINTLPLHHGKVLTGSEGGGSAPETDIPRYVRMMADGIFDPAGFITHRAPLCEINHLIAKMRAGEVINALLQC
jgi:S-(hydroxymethyl)glutathione dehydrogenase / alcohol dehydrogenase